MQELILTIGLPASGKTTWMLEFIQRHPTFYNINRDDIRLMIQGRGRYNKFTKTREGFVSTMQFSAAKHALLAGRDVIISDTNLNPTFRDKWKAFAKNFLEKNGVEVQYNEKLFTDTPLGVCLERDKLREYPVGTKVIMGMFDKYQDIYWPKPDPELNKKLTPAYIVDVDGTVAKMNGRRPYEWDKVGEDLPNDDVIYIINTLSNIGNKIIICSGRDGVSENDTKAWLDTHGVQYDHFYIRPAGDSRKDYVIKEEIYREHIQGKFNIKGVFDDRDQVVHVWRHLGLTTMQVNYGSF